MSRNYSSGSSSSDNSLTFNFEIRKKELLNIIKENNSCKDGIEPSAKISTQRTKSKMKKIKRIGKEKKREKEMKRKKKEWESEEMEEKQLEMES